MLAKLKAYCIDDNSVTFMRSYLENRLQRFKMNNSFSECEKELAGVQKISVLAAAFQDLHKLHFLNYSRV